MYDDSEERYRNDSEFHSVVDVMQALIMKHGFTPGEMKQAAFYAACLVEMRTIRPIQVSESDFIAFRRWKDANDELNRKPGR
jgi:hypothetical protein